MSGSVTRDKATAFAIRIYKLYQVLFGRKEYILSKQIARSGTAIGALLMESQHAQSNADFINKVNIALKEANETLYWLYLLYRRENISEREYNSLKEDCDELIRLTSSIVKTSKEKNKTNNVER